MLNDRRLSATAATLSVPMKLTQPCIRVPGWLNEPGQAGAGPTPGQRMPQPKVPGSMSIRMMGGTSDATAARTAATADGQGSPWRPGGSAPVSGRHVTDSLDGLGRLVAEGVGDGGLTDGGLTDGVLSDGAVDGEGAIPQATSVTAASTAPAPNSHRPVVMARV